VIKAVKLLTGHLVGDSVFLLLRGLYCNRGAVLRYKVLFCSLYIDLWYDTNKPLVTILVQSLFHCTMSQMHMLADFICLKTNQNV